jgi:NADH-quinone oxidoreductase subunit J
MDSLEQFLVFAFAALAAVGAGGFVVFRQPVHAALSFAVTVLSCTGLYLMQKAPYAAVSTIIVYAGATIIIFLFALMFSQRSKLQIYDLEKSNPISSVIASTALVGLLAVAAFSFSETTNSEESPQTIAVDAGSDASVADESREPAPGPRVADLGRVMYTRYLWAIEVAGAILLVATLGAIQIAREELSPNLKPENPTP